MHGGDRRAWWRATSRHSPKARHLLHEPRISLTYWDAEQDVVNVHGRASWVDDQVTKNRIWSLDVRTPPSLGYDPGEVWLGGPDDPAFGLLRIDVTRIELTGMATSGKPRLLWRPSH